MSPPWPRVSAVVVKSLTDRQPAPSHEELLASLVPPPQFANVSFDSYLADPAQPSQSAAVSALEAFAAERGAETGGGRRWLRRRSAPPEARPGVYLDGGFGVGKTHLLASLWHAHRGPKSFGTFVEYTNLIGALGFSAAVAAFADRALVCIDEFELDDPGDTVLMSTFLGRLVDQGVRLAATSNTLPDRLGEGRFAADDFLREIQALSAHFEVLRIDGDDYRHRGEVRPAEVFDTSGSAGPGQHHPGCRRRRFRRLARAPAPRPPVEIRRHGRGPFTAVPSGRQAVAGSGRRVALRGAR